MRITIRKRIENTAKILKLNASHIEFLLWLYDNQEDGIISFETRKWEYINSRGLNLEEVYINCQALIDYGFIKSCSYGDLQILACSDIHLTNILHKNLKKRMYNKNPLLEQENIFSLFGKGIREAYQFIATRVERPEDLSIPKEIRFTIQGIKIPIVFRPYLASELLSDHEIHGIPDNYKHFYFEEEHDKEYLASLEEQRRNLSKEEKRVFLAIFYMCRNGKIDDFTNAAFLETLSNLFGQVYKKTTVNDAINKLQKLWFIKIEGGSLYVRFYKDSFGSGKNYVVVSAAVLKKAFKKLQAGAIKAFFYFAFLLNNGETTNRHGLIESGGQNKTVYFKVGSLSTETVEQKKRFRKNKSWLKRRSSKEIKDILLGIYKKNGDYTCLAEYFDFYMLDNGALQVRMRKEYYIKKKTVIEAPKIEPKLRYSRKAKVIEEVLEEANIQLQEEDKQSLIKIFRWTGRKVIKVLVQYMADRMQRIKIENIGGYMTALHRSYTEGTFNPGYVN